MPDTVTIDKDELAGLLKLSPAHFMRKRQALVAGGMPRPVSDALGNPVWSRKNILAWIDGDMTIAPPAARRAGGRR